MLEWVTGGALIALLIVFLNVLLLGLAAVLLGTMPANYFTRPAVLRPWFVTFLLNIPGFLLLLVGLVMLLLPGPGLLMIVAGLVLISSPRKTRLLKSLVVRPGIYRFIARMRARFNRPMLEITPKMQRALNDASKKESQ